MVTSRKGVRVFLQSLRDSGQTNGVFGLLILYQLHKVVGIRSTTRESKVPAGISNILELQLGAILWDKFSEGLHDVLQFDGSL